MARLVIGAASGLVVTEWVSPCVACLAAVLRAFADGWFTPESGLTQAVTTHPSASAGLTFWPSDSSASAFLLHAPRGSVHHRVGYAAPLGIESTHKP